MAGASLHKFYVVTPKVIVPYILYVMADPSITHTHTQLSSLDTQWIT